MSGAEDEDQMDSAFYPGFKRRVKTETEESPESYQAMLQQMQDRMGKMEEKYDTTKHENAKCRVAIGNQEAKIAVWHPMRSPRAATGILRGATPRATPPRDTRGSQHAAYQLNVSHGGQPHIATRELALSTATATTGTATHTPGYNTPPMIY